MDEKVAPVTLLSDAELPAWMLREEAAEAAEVDGEDGEAGALGRRRRAAARARSYNEAEEEAEFLRAVLVNPEDGEARLSAAQVFILFFLGAVGLRVREWRGECVDAA